MKRYLPRPQFKPGDRVTILPLESIAGRIVEVSNTAEEGWIYVARYFQNGEAKTARLFPDELECPAAAPPT